MYVYLFIHINIHIYIYSLFIYTKSENTVNKNYMNICTYLYMCSFILNFIAGPKDLLCEHPAELLREHPALSALRAPAR